MNETSVNPQGGLTRRTVLRVGTGVALVAVVGYSAARTVTAPSDTGRLVTPQDAFDLATTKAATLVDIRRPDEWARTGVGQGAHPLDMRRDDFTDALAALVQQDRSSPIVLICAGGVRSKFMAQRLAKAGFTNIIDVPEGMLGSRVGVGWIRRGLPTVPYSES